MSLKKTLRKLIGKRGTKRLYRAAPWMGLTLAVIGASKTEKGREMLETAKDAASDAFGDHRERTMPVTS